MSEWQFIDWIRKESSLQTAPDNRVILGPGDDAGIVRIGSTEVLAAADMLIEGVHFNMNQTPPEMIGRKALAVNLSDMAAMGCRPICALSSIAVPVEHGMEVAQRITRGLVELASTFNVALLGGDTNSWGAGKPTNSDGKIIVAVTVLGETWPGQKAIRRSGAKPGDQVLVTGTLGGSLATDGNGRHLSFVPRVWESKQLMESGPIHAMIDLSDGLATDASHIARESNLTVQLERRDIPVSNEIRNLDSEEQLNRALGDGEDFELLFTTSAENAQKLLALLPLPGVTITRIGFCTAGPPQVTWTDGIPIPRRGFEHGMNP